MEHPELFDGEGYPTDDALARLTHWSLVQGQMREDINAGLDFARALWNLTYGSAREKLNKAEREVLHAAPGERFLRFATGGWSGNESVISALEQNRMLCGFTWRLSASGGLHIYRYMP